MKKVLIIGLVLSFNATAESWKACGVDADSARANLSNSIYSEISSEMSSKEELSSGMFGDIFSKNQKRNISSKSNIVASGIKVKKVGNQYCASLERDTLLQFTREGLLNKADDCSLDKLPGYEKDKVRYIAECVSNFKQVKQLALVFNKELGKPVYTRMSEKEFKFMAARSKYNTQFVKVNVTGAKASLKIDNKSKKMGEEVFLKPGNHTYTIISNEYCPINRNVKLVAAKDQQIIIDLTKNAFPRLNINSNKSSAKLKINGTSWALGSDKVFNVCDGQKVAYTVEYYDGKEKLRETGVFSLKPGNSEVKSFDFLSAQEQRELAKLSAAYESGKRLELKYSFPVYPSRYDNLESMNNFELSYVTSKNWLRQGYSILYGKGSNSTVLEGLYNIGFQFTRYGNKSRAIQLEGITTVVPYVGVQVGLGDHDIYDEVAGTSTNNYPDTVGGSSSFYNDHVVLRAIGAVDFTVSNTIGVQLFFAANFTMEESYLFGLGLSLKL